MHTHLSSAGSLCTYFITTANDLHVLTSLIFILVIVDDGNSLILLSGLHFAVLLGTGRLFAWWSGVLAIIRVTGLLCVVFGTLVVKVILFLVFILLSVLSLGALGLLLWCCSVSA